MLIFHATSLTKGPWPKIGQNLIFQFLLRLDTLGCFTDCNKLELQITSSHENIFVFCSRIIIHRNIVLSRRKIHEVTDNFFVPFLVSGGVRCLHQHPPGCQSQWLLVFRALVLQIVNLILYFSQQSNFVIPQSRRILLIQELK